ncbi:hypothetical protein [Tabrizicola sp. M-4]|uniref:hypothetical protein n=1 Tax=Tabrizicola sp. M-4 TaxID=3055847 RepID=UPI003DA96794
MTDDRLDPTIEAELFMLDFNGRLEESERFAKSPEGAALLRLVADERQRAEETKAALGALRRQVTEQERRGRNQTVLLWGIVAMLALYINGYLPFW